MTVPLMVLAAGSVLAGYLGIPAVIGHVAHVGNFFEGFLDPVFEPAHHALATVFPHPAEGAGLEWGLMFASVAVATAGIFLARYFYKSRPDLPAQLAQTFAAPHRLLFNKYYVDEVYSALFVRGLALGGGNALHAVDRKVIDGGDGEVRPGLGVNGVGWLVRDVVGQLSDVWDRYVVDAAVNLTAFVLENVSYVFRAVQNGQVQHYALAMLIGLFLMVGFVGRFLLGLY
jgi:NADH-quinone oxidoreductase subunit L